MPKKSSRVCGNSALEALALAVKDLLNNTPMIPSAVLWIVRKANSFHGQQASKKNGLH
jgi:hypothetical protein